MKVNAGKRKRLGSILFVLLAAGFLYCVFSFQYAVSPSRELKVDLNDAEPAVFSLQEELGFSFEKTDTPLKAPARGGCFFERQQQTFYAFLERERDENDRFTGHILLCCQNMDTREQEIFCRTEDRQISYSAIQPAKGYFYWKAENDIRGSAADITVFQYQQETGQAEVILEREQIRRDFSFAAWEQFLYWYEETEGTTSLIQYDTQTEEKEVIAENLFGGFGGLIRQNDGILAYVDGKREEIVRYNLKEGEIYDRAYVGKQAGYIDSPQANENYAAWLMLNENFQGFDLIVFCYSSAAIYQVQISGLHFRVDEPCSYYFMGDHRLVIQKEDRSWILDLESKTYWLLEEAA